jgi:hypothetical protein
MEFRQKEYVSRDHFMITLSIGGKRTFENDDMAILQIDDKKNKEAAVSILQCILFY